MLLFVKTDVVCCALLLLAVLAVLAAVVAALVVVVVAMLAGMVLVWSCSCACCGGCWWMVVLLLLSSLSSASFHGRAQSNSLPSLSTIVFRGDAGNNAAAFSCSTGTCSWSLGIGAAAPAVLQRSFAQASKGALTTRVEWWHASGCMHSLPSLPCRPCLAQVPQVLTAHRLRL